MFEDTNPRSMKELLGQIHSSDSALPEFQRDFVWDPGATRELIVSVAKGFPAGSILRIRNTGGNGLFASREFQGSRPLDGHRPTYLVLDGQQRLTSLYQAFYGVGEYRYFIDLRKMLDGEEFEECIFSLKANRLQARRYEQIAPQAEDMILPLSVLKDDPIGGFSSWILDASSHRHSDDANALIKLQQELRERIQQYWVKTIDDYQFPVVTLREETEAEAVCTIFETLNRTGVKLTAFDLLTARFWPQQINLRGKWDDAKDQYPILNEMDIDPYYLLQALTLCARSTPGCKRGEVLDLKGDDFRAWWDKIVRGYSIALEYLRDDCGVIAPKWLPYAAIPIPMAAVLAKTQSSGPEVGANRHRLVRWYWCSVLNQTYDNPPNSQAAKDFVELRAWFSGGKEPDAIVNFDFGKVDNLRQVTFRQRALYRGLMGLIIRNMAKDFHTERPITSAVMREQQIDDHHIFPDGYLRGEEQNYPPNSGDNILNRTLIDSETNKRIGKKAPSVYIGEIEDLRGTTRVNDLLDSHFCTSKELKDNNFEEFLAGRETKFWNAIRDVTN